MIAPNINENLFFQWFQFIFYLGMMFICTSYTAKIITLLQATTKTINSLEKLISTEIELGAQDTPYNRYYLANLKDETRSKLYQKKIARSNEVSKFSDVEYGIEKMRKVMLAIVVMSPNLNHWRFNFFHFEGIFCISRWIGLRLRSSATNLYGKWEMWFDGNQVLWLGKSMACDSKIFSFKRND